MTSMRNKLFVLMSVVNAIISKGAFWQGKNPQFCFFTLSGHIVLLELPEIVIEYFELDKCKIPNFKAWKIKFASIG